MCRPQCKLVENARWDNDLLAVEFQDLIDVDVIVFRLRRSTSFWTICLRWIRLKQTCGLRCGAFGL